MTLLSRSRYDIWRSPVADQAIFLPLEELGEGEIHVLSTAQQGSKYVREAAKAPTTKGSRDRSRRTLHKPVKETALEI